MDEKETHKLIGKLGSAVVFLSVIVIGLIITILVLFAFQEPDEEKTEDYAICGNSILNPINKSPNYTRVEQLFNQNCASCHFPHKDMTGPALKGARERGDENAYEGWIYDFLLKQDSLIQIKDPYTLKLKSENWGESNNHKHQITKQDIDDIMAYVN